MYLTGKQHDELRTLVMNAEIPYRTYIAKELVSRYKTVDDFVNILTHKESNGTLSIDNQTYSSGLGQIKTHAKHIYTLLSNSVQSVGKLIINNDIDVPSVSQLNIVLLTFKEHFHSFLCRFKDINEFWEQASKYQYVRNKLNHPGCKTLERVDMSIVLEFLSNTCSHINAYDEECFYLKSYADIERQIIALKSEQPSIPLRIHNINDMPFSDSHLVCRENEIKEIKNFIYGIPGALRKKSTYCIFGYGGVGKTALVLESIKSIIQDLQDKTTINGYVADFILFFSAKNTSLDISITSGKIEHKTANKTFTNADQLIQNINSALKIDTFVGYDKTGIIIIDNLESLSDEERKKVKDFLCFQTPPSIQFIITSRNEEDYDERKKLAGFEDESAGKQFIMEYIEENNLGISLSDNDYKTLLNICKGNTLVLVLSLRRLSYNVDNLESLAADMTYCSSVQKISNEFENLPFNGYEIISEYMYKNTFGEIEQIFNTKTELIYAILKIFAVYPSDTIDIYTLSILIDDSLSAIENILNMLCKYLIIEKQHGLYSLNQFAEKYIIQRFLPDTESYNKLSSEIEKNTRKIQNDINKMQTYMERNPSLKKIIQDWYIVTDGDKIAAARVFSLYHQVDQDCQIGSRFHIDSTYREAIAGIKNIEKNTMHPYVKYQKARILNRIKTTGYKNDLIDKEILDAYNEALWVIKTNPIYDSIKYTKSYASVLWLYGTQLFEISSPNMLNGLMLAIKNLEDAQKAFEQLNIFTDEYYQCLTRLGFAYLELYKLDRSQYIMYLRMSRSISNFLYENRNKYVRKVKKYATNLRSELQKYGRY